MAFIENRLTTGRRKHDQEESLLCGTHSVNKNKNTKQEFQIYLVYTVGATLHPHFVTVNDCGEPQMINKVGRYATHQGIISLIKGTL